MNLKEKESTLPVSSSQLEEFIDGIIKDFRLPKTEKTREAIATQILHLDNRIGKVKRSYFADCAVKFLANGAAFDLIEGIKKREAAEAEQAKKEAAEKALLESTEKQPASVEQ